MKWRQFRDILSARIIRILIILSNSIVFLIFTGLLIKSRSILLKKPLLELIFSSDWHPLKGNFGFYSFIVGTIEVTLIAMALAIPLSILSAIYLSEYANRKLRKFITFIIDLLAAIPSVIYGLFGVIVVVPLVRNLGQFLGKSTTGYSLMSGGIILAIMVLPVIISISVEVLLTIPTEARESALAMGATKWETIKYVVIRKSFAGILAAIILGFTRALGETMAVLMVVGNVPAIPGSIFDPAYPLPALIANNYGEMMSIPLYNSALMLAALILFLIVTGFSLFANIIILKVEKSVR